MSFISAIPTVRPLYSTAVAVTIKVYDYATLTEVSTLTTVYLISSRDTITVTEVSKLTVHIPVKDVGKVSELVTSLTQLGLLKVKSIEKIKVVDVKTCRTHTINIGGVEVPLVCPHSMIMPEDHNNLFYACKNLLNRLVEIKNILDEAKSVLEGA